VKAAGHTGRVAWRLGVCAVLLGWAFHTIFLSEARQLHESRGGAWAAMDWREQARLAWTVGPPALAGVLGMIRPLEGVLSLLFMGATILLGAVRWRGVLRAQGMNLPAGRVLELSLVAHGFNAFLLGSTGGDLVKAYYTAAETHHLKAEAVVSVIVDRLLGLLAMLLFAAAMMVPNLDLLTRQPRLGVLALVALGMLGGLLVLGGLSFQGGLSRLWPGARDWLRRLPKGETLERALEAMRRLGRQRGVLARALAISMALNFACVLQIWVLARGLGLEIPFRFLLVLVPIIICLAALPITPSGLGLRENLYVLALTVPAVRVPPAAALSLSLLAYAGSLAWSLVGGLVYLRFRRGHPAPPSEA